MPGQEVLPAQIEQSLECVGHVSMGQSMTFGLLFLNTYTTFRMRYLLCYFTAALWQIRHTALY